VLTKDEFRRSSRRSAMDTNGDGTVTRDEMRYALRTTRKRLRRRRD
jgi:hypothetical protein